ncbi:MAG: HAD-IB family hydrolase [Thermoplasmata archaeon]
MIPDCSRAGRAAAFFDLDGTLIRGHMILDFPDHLLSAGLFDPEIHRKIREMREDHRTGKLLYRKVAEALPSLYAEGLRGRRVSDVKLVAESFVAERMKEVYDYSMPLVALMADSGRPGVALSGSPVETVLPMARRLGMEAAFGTELEVGGGRYTGRVLRNMILGETKRPVYEQIVELDGIDEANSFGFGDTEEDISFLERVGWPVALNPAPGLRATALRNGWTILAHGEEVVARVGELLKRVEEGREGAGLSGRRL